MFKHSNFFVLRRPLSSLNALQDFYSELHHNSISLTDKLRGWFSDPQHLQALESASPFFYARACQWLSGKSLSDEAKIVNTLHKYMIRMTTRSTPYGRFAGCAVGTVGRQTHFKIGCPDSALSQTRLDMSILLAIKAWLVKQPAIRRQLRFFTNSTLYTAGDYLRFVEQQQDGMNCTYFISALLNSNLLTTLFSEAQHGLTGDEVCSLIEQLGSFTYDEAMQYTDELINCQLLQVEIEPALTGSVDYLTAILSCIERMANCLVVTDAHRSIKSLLQLLQTHPLPQEELLSVLRQIPLGLTIKDIVQVDTLLPDDQHELGVQWLTGFQRQLEALLVFNQPFVSSDLDEFKRRFYIRYEEEEVPLSIAIDHEMGVGYGATSALGVCVAPMVDTLSISESKASQLSAQPLTWQTFLLHRYAQALRCQQSEIVLTDADLQAIGSKTSRSTTLPHSFYAFGTLLAASDKAIDKDQYRFVLSSCKGPSALNLISRFGYADPKLAAHARICARQEEDSNPDVIIAEVIHCPEARVGNVLGRPSLYQYEIPYLGKSSVAPSYQIPISDLYVSISHNQIVLRSKRLNKRVIPRLSNAHNFTNGLPVYQFLCNLQFQDAYIDLHWNWGDLAEEVYLPRVRYKDIIISRATWHVTTMSLSADCPVQLVDQLRGLGLPNRFFITKDDYELCIDLTIEASLHLLSQELRKTAKVRLVECLTTHDTSPVQDKRGNVYAHELVLPFHIPSAPAYKPIDKPVNHLSQRRFSIGSEWLYIKVYSGEKLLDELLVDHLYPVVQKLFEENTIQQFFFIRYKDPETHLRIRFKGNPSQEFHVLVLRQIEQQLRPLVQNALVYRIQTDTYQREVERYGTHNMTLCEQLFCCDSVTTLKFLQQTGTTFDENTRFAFAVYKIDRILIDLLISVAERHELLEALKEQFFTEFNGDSNLRKELNQKYKAYKLTIEHTLNQHALSMSDYAIWLDEQRLCLTRLQTINAHNGGFNQVIKSLVHMIINRLFPTKQRAYELVIYHCLAKHYASVSALSSMCKNSY